MFKISSKQLESIKNYFSIIPEAEIVEFLEDMTKAEIADLLEKIEEQKEMIRLRDTDPDKFLMIEALIAEDFDETEEYINSLREIAGLY